MRVPLSLLLSMCDPGLSPEEIADVLALSGTEVERITRIGVGDQENLVVGRVTAAEQHPDADRLRVCTVDVGDGQARTIVCGAPNVAAGQTVAVALPGAVVAGGMKIKKAKLRGVASEGMICAEDELGLGSEHDGILVLADDEASPGAQLSEVLVLSETVLELEITPNRPDCLGVWGVARELHAATGAPLATPPWEDDPGSDGEPAGISITVEPDSGCPRFTARVFDGIDADAATPALMRMQLQAAGMRPISPAVDITNFAMLVTGEPLHAFDLDRIAGAELTVRLARDGEQVSTLDGQTRNLTGEDVVIVDGDGPTSIAGLMGGERSEVSARTTRVLLEAAVWDGPRLHATSNRLGLRSEASTRFEKGIAPVQAARAIAFASKLLAGICGCAPQPGTVDIGGPGAAPAAITLDLAAASGLLGSAVDEADAREALTRLGCVVAAGDGDALAVTPPPERLDLERPVDLVEEIARIHGLDRIPASEAAVRGEPARLTQLQAVRRRIEDILVARGCFEIAGWSFSSPAIRRRLLLPEPAPDSTMLPVMLENPMSTEESQLRTHLLGTLLDAAAGNVAHGERSLRLFEAGPVYLAGPDGEVIEPVHACALLTGTVMRPDWLSQDPPAVDVHTAAGLLADVLDTLRLDWATVPPTVAEPFLHPGRSAVVEVAGAPVGWLGELHPEVLAAWGLPASAAFEIDLTRLPSGSPADLQYVPFSDQPALLQDLAVIVPDSVAAASLVGVARAAGGGELESVEVFDVYRGSQVGEEEVSIGLRLTFRAADRTLTEDEATVIRAAIIERLEAEFGARARV